MCYVDEKHMSFFIADVEAMICKSRQIGPLGVCNEKNVELNMLLELCNEV